MQDRPAISVVIPALDAEATIGAQLAAVLAQDCTVEFEVLVADNGSSDATPELVRAMAAEDPRVRLVDASRASRGSGAARNAGVAAAAAPLLAFCDADDVVAPGWLQHVYLGLLQERVVSVTKEYWSLNPGLPRQLYPEFQHEVAYYGVPVFSSGAFGIHRDAYEKVGGFDTAMDAGANDTDFALRLYAQLRTPPLHLREAVVQCRVPTTARPRFRRYRALARTRSPIMKRHKSLMRNTRRAEVRRRFRATAWLFYRLPYLWRGPLRLRWAQNFGTWLGEIEGPAIAAIRHVHEPAGS